MRGYFYNLDRTKKISQGHLKRRGGWNICSMSVDFACICTRCPRTMCVCNPINTAPSPRWPWDKLLFHAVYLITTYLFRKGGGRRVAAAAGPLHQRAETWRWDLTISFLANCTFQSCVYPCLFKWALAWEWIVIITHLCSCPQLCKACDLIVFATVFVAF